MTAEYVLKNGWYFLQIFMRLGVLDLLARSCDLFFDLEHLDLLFSGFGALEVVAEILREGFFAFFVLVPRGLLVLYANGWRDWSTREQIYQ